MTIDDILAIQDHAIRTGDLALRKLAWAALGYDCTVAFELVDEGERRRALHKLTTRENHE